MLALESGHYSTTI
uniref:Uncharacterized protein n=1 Tax=Arundo donax TaxID=35708 RepID=A0A0A9H668_ARUDO